VATISNRSNRGSQADPWQCARLCQEEAQCNFAFYKRSHGECRLLRECGQRGSTAVGNRANQGGITFQKFRNPLLIARDDWPSKYFGSYAGVTDSDPPTLTSGADWSTLTTLNRDFVTSGTHRGYDWSLPSSAQASPTGRVAYIRTWGLNNGQFRLVRDAPTVDGLNVALEAWVYWRHVEPNDNEFDFSLVDAMIRLCEEKGITMYLRLMTSDQETAPESFSNLGIPLAVTPEPCTRRPQPWDITHPEFHTRYVRLVHRMTRYCNSSTVANVYAGWLSCTWGDEGIGPDHHNYAEGG